MSDRGNVIDLPDVDLVACACCGRCLSAFGGYICTLDGESVCDEACLTACELAVDPQREVIS